MSSNGGFVNLRVTNVTATAPIVSSGGATPDISIPEASISQDGYLSAVDWGRFNSGSAGALNFREAYDNAVQYFENDIVYYFGSGYVCLAENHGGPPPTHPELWSPIAIGIQTFTPPLSFDPDSGTLTVSGLNTFRGGWDNDTAFVVNDTVNYFGSLYICIGNNHSAIPPSSPEQWQAMAIGIGSVGTGLSFDNLTGELSATPAIGTDNTFAAFDASGNLGTLSGWQVNSVTGGALVQLNQSITTDNYGQNVNSFDSDIDPTIDTTNVSYANVNFDLHIDRSGTNHNMGSQLNNLNIHTSHEGAGTLNNLYAIISGVNLGNASSAGTTTQAGHGIFDANIANAYTVQDFSGIQFSFSVDPGGALTQDLKHLGLNASGNVGRNFDHIYSYSEAVVAGFMRGINFDINGSSTGDLNVFSSQINCNVGGSFEGLHINMAGTSASATLSGLSNSGVVAGTLNGINLNNSNTGTSHDFYAMVVGQNANATNTSRGFDVHIDGDAANKIMFNMYSNSGAVTDWTGGNLTAGGSASNSVTGLNINLSQITSPNQKIGLQINDGVLSAQSNYDTAILPASPGFLSINALGGEFHIAAGHPMTNTIAFGNNLGINALFEDDMGPDPLGGLIGYTQNVYASQIVVATGKVVDTVNLCMSGAQIADVSPGITDGGTVTNMAIFRGIGLLPAGGNIIVTNMYGLKIDAFLSGFAVNAWGVYVADTGADNYFAKNVVIGGVTGKPTGSFALDVTGSANISDTLTAANLISTGGASGTFTTVDLKTVTVTSGIITSIV